MLKRRIGLVVAVLCLLLSCACLSESMPIGAAPAAPRENVLADTPKTFVFAFNLSKEDNDGKELALALIQPLLAQYQGTETNVILYQIKENGMFLGQYSLMNADDMDACLTKLAKMQLEGVQQPEKVYLEFCKELNRQYRNNALGNTELWLFESRKPLTIAWNALFLPSDVLSAGDNLQQLMAACPALRLHYVFIGDYVSADTTPKTEYRIDDYLKSMLADQADRVVTHVLPKDHAYNTTTGANSLMGIVRTYYRAAIEVPAIPPADSGNARELDFTYQHSAQAGLNDVLFFLDCPKNEVANIRISFVSAEAAPQQQPTYAMYSSGRYTWLVLRDVPAGAYQIIVSLKSALTSAAPIKLYPFLIAKHSTVSITCGQIVGGTGTTDRDSLQFVITTDATDIPVELWQVSMQMNGKPFTIEVQPLQEEEGQYQWQATVAKEQLVAGSTVSFSAVLSLEAPHALVLQSNAIQASFGNRPPKAAEEVPILAAYLDAPVLENGEVFQLPACEYDLSRLFTDADGDALTYYFAADAQGNASIESNIFTYLPDAENASTATFTVLAKDPYGGESEPLTFTVRQQSVAELISLMRYGLATGGESNILEKDEEYCGPLGEELTLLFELLPVDAFPGFDQLLLGALKLAPLEEYFQIECTVTDGASAAEPLAVTVQGQSICVRLPALEDTATYTLTCTANYLGLPLPNLMEPIEISAQNTAPSLRRSDIPMVLTAIMQGTPSEYQPITLAEVMGLAPDTPILLNDYFTDAETPEKLTYFFQLKGSAAYSVMYRGQELTKAEGGGYRLTASPEDSTCPIQIVITRPGTLELQAYASDGYLSSTQAALISIKVQSAFTQQVLPIGLIGLGVLLMAAALLLVLYCIKPAYHDTSLAILSTEYGVPEPDLSGVKGLSLGIYHKKTVSLLTLVIALGQPPVQSIPVSCLADIKVSPSKKGWVRITCGDQAQQHQLRFGKHGAITAKKAFDIPRHTTVVPLTCAANPNECIYLIFSGEQRAFHSL